jgi:hypothetical protein
MAISTFLDPTQMPARTQDQQTFDNLMAAFMQKLPTFGAEVNATAALINSLAAGGAYAIPVVFSTLTADADPSSTGVAGMLRLDNATQSSATTIRVDLLNSASQDVSPIVNTFADSTSVVKGHIRLVKQGDASKWLQFAVTGMASPTGYRNVSVTPMSGSSASPFANNDALMLFFQRTGDAGATGPVNTIPHAKFSEQYTSGTGGGATGTGTVTRPLNTVVDNNITGASLASNVITLPAGTYDFQGRAGAVGTVNGFNRVQLLNVTDSITYYGSGRALGNSGTNDNVDSIITGRFTISASKTFRLQSYVGANSTNFGAPMNSGGPEIYSEIEFFKVA